MTHHTFTLTPEAYAVVRSHLAGSAAGRQVARDLNRQVAAATFAVLEDQARARQAGDRLNRTLTAGTSTPERAVSDPQTQQRFGDEVDRANRAALAAHLHRLAF